MPKQPRVVIPGLPHHITHRSNRGEDVFVEAVDRELYLRLLRKYATRSGVRVAAYCLMTNHVHLVVIPKNSKSLGEAIGTTHGHFASLFNEKYRTQGHLWHSRFFSCVLDEAHFWNAIRYVELNPVRAGLSRRAEDYPWSSARAHCEKRPDWSAWLAHGNDLGVDDQLRKHTRLGLPCGLPKGAAPSLRQQRQLMR